MPVCSDVTRRPLLTIKGTKALSGAWVPTRRVRILFAERIDRGKNQRSRDHLCKRLRSHKSVTCGTSMRLRRHGNSHGLRRGDGFSHDQPGLQYDSFSFPAMSLQLLREQLHGDLAHHLLGLPYGRDRASEIRREIDVIEHDQRDICGRSEEQTSELQSREKLV